MQGFTRMNPPYHPTVYCDMLGYGYATLDFKTGQRTIRDNKNIMNDQEQPFPIDKMLESFHQREDHLQRMLGTLNETFDKKLAELIKKHLLAQLD